MKASGGREARVVNRTCSWRETGNDRRKQTGVREVKVWDNKTRLALVCKERKGHIFVMTYGQKR